MGCDEGGWEWEQARRLKGERSDEQQRILPGEGTTGWVSMKLGTRQQWLLRLVNGASEWLSVPKPIRGDRIGEVARFKAIAGLQQASLDWLAGS